MLDVINRLVEQLGDVVVVQAVDDASAGASSRDEPEGAQQPKLMRDSRLRHSHILSKVVDRDRPTAQSRENQQPGSDWPTPARLRRRRQRSRRRAPLRGCPYLALRGPYLTF